MTSRPGATGNGDRLGWFNGLPRATAAAALLTICHSHRWADRVADGRPYASRDALAQAADEIWLALDPADWKEALEGHPRIGESGGSSGDFSRQEQAGMSGAADAVRKAIADGNRRYEDRFGHVFLISAAGRSPDEILAALTARLDNAPETELKVAAEEHRRITRLRLEKLIPAG
jgi:OHCU decarboxylase